MSSEAHGIGYCFVPSGENLKAELSVCSTWMLGEWTLSVHQ